MKKGMKAYYVLRCSNLCYGGMLLGEYDTLFDANRAYSHTEKYGCRVIEKRFR